MVFLNGALGSQKLRTHDGCRIIALEQAGAVGILKSCKCLAPKLLSVTRIENCSGRKNLGQSFSEGFLQISLQQFRWIISTDQSCAVKFKNAFEIFPEDFRKVFLEHLYRSFSNLYSNDLLWFLRKRSLRNDFFRCSQVVSEVFLAFFCIFSEHR